MSLRLFRSKSVAGNARLLNLFSFWFCLRFFTVVAVIYFAHVTGSYFLAASLLVICRVAQGVFEVPSGIVSDRFGRVWCLRLGAIASIVSVAFYLLGGAFWWLAVGAVFDGLWMALFSGNNEALLYESAKESGESNLFAHHLGQINVAMEVAGFLATIGGGFMAIYGFGIGLWLTLAAQSVALLASFGLAEPTRHTAPSTLSAWGHFREAFGYMRRNVILRDMSLGQIIGGGTDTFALWPAFYSQFLPVWATGAMVSVNYLQSAIGFRLSGWVLRRFKAINVILAGDAWSRVLMLPALALPSPVSPILMALGGAPYGPTVVAMGTILHAEFTDHQRATMASITSVLSSILYAVFALVIGVVADHLGPGRAILIGQLCTLPVLWLTWRVRRHLSYNTSANQL